MAKRSHALHSEGKLIICPTPLGNLGDMTQRALDALRECDVVCCEDTRVTGKLLLALGIEAKRLERLDEALLGSHAQRIIDRVVAGEIVAYCSDAGMPGVSDPGQRLVAAAHQNNVRVEVLPGGTAVATAYVASGFTAQSFYFGGFFPRKEGERGRLLELLRGLGAVLIFYESPQRIVSALEAVDAVMPSRQVAVCRELTKIHEEVLCSSPRALRDELDARAQNGLLKGEIVLVIDAPGKEEQNQAAHDARVGASCRAEELLSQGDLSKKDIARLLRSEYGLARNEAYELVHALCEQAT